LGVIFAVKPLLKQLPATVHEIGNAQIGGLKMKWLKKHEVSIVLFLGVLGVFILPYVFTRPWIGDFTESGQIGDTIGGTTAPFIGLLSAWLVYRAFKAQIEANELISRQLKIEENRYMEGQIKDRETTQAANFLKMYETYVRALNGMSFVKIETDILIRHPHNTFSYELSGKQLIEELIFKDVYVRHNICNIDFSKDIQPQLHEISLDKIEHWYKLVPLFRVTYHLLKQELAQDGVQKWENIRFFRAQLSEPELNVMAINALFDNEGRIGLAVVAKKSGLFKHLKSQLLVELLKEEANSDGFFDTKIAEKIYASQPVKLTQKRA
jgi:hypothetical protein